MLDVVVGGLGLVVVVGGDDGVVVKCADHPRTGSRVSGGKSAGFTVELLLFVLMCTKERKMEKSIVNIPLASGDIAHRTIAARLLPAARVEWWRLHWLNITSLSSSLEHV